MTEAEIFEFFHNLGIVPVVKIDDASKAEQAIVYANAYRPDYTDCDSLVSKSYSPFNFIK